MGSTEDRGDDYKEPFIDGFSEKAIFQRGLMALRRASCAVTLMLLAFMLVCGMQGRLLAGILGVLVWVITAHAIDVGQRALSVAIETEEECRESRENYERLSGEICLRKFKEGPRNE